jgi:hypothetical protein
VSLAVGSARENQSAYTTRRQIDGTRWRKGNTSCKCQERAEAGLSFESVGDWAWACRRFAGPRRGLVGADDGGPMLMPKMLACCCPTGAKPLLRFLFFCFETPVLFFFSFPRRPRPHPLPRSLAPSPSSSFARPRPAPPRPGPKPPDVPDVFSANTQFTRHESCVQRKRLASGGWLSAQAEQRALTGEWPAT